MARRKTTAPEGATSNTVDPVKDPTLAATAPQGTSETPPVVTEAPATQGAPNAEQPPETPPASQDNSQDPPDATAPLKLKDFVAHHEQAAQDLGVVVVSVTHPDAEPGIRQGTYSGIRMAEGEPSATYSDGSTH